MPYRVEVAPAAAEEVERTFRWLFEHEPVKAIEWLDRVEEAFASLSDRPLRCPLAPESSWFEVEIRQLLIGKKPNVYRALFTVRGRTVVVVYFRGPGQAWVAS